MRLISSHLEDEESRRALKDAFEDVLCSLENGDILDILQTTKELIKKYTETPKKITVIPGALFMS